MTAATVPGIDEAPTSNARLLSWVREIAELTAPDRVVWCDGSDAEWDRMTTDLVEAGTFGRLDEEKKPNSFWAASDPDDVARVEERTFICSSEPAGAGPTNNWVDPAEMKSTMTELYRGCMRGRTMFVIPFCMGPLDAEHPMLGVEITDSEYVVGLHEDHDPDGRRGAAAVRRGGRPVRALPALGRRAARARRGRRAVAVQPDEVHQPLPGDPGDLELRLRLRRQRAARQEVLRAADRLGHRPRRGLARRAHADPQADQPGGEGLLHRRRVPVGLRQDQPGHAAADRFPAGARRRSATTSPGCGSGRTAGSTRSTRSTASSASPRAPTGRPTRTR